MRRIVGITALVCLLSAPSLFAQKSWWDPEFEAGPFVGVGLSKGFDFETPVSGSPSETSRTVGMQYRSGFHFGARLSQNVNDYWTTDLEYSFANQRLELTNLSPTIPGLSLGHSIHHFTYNVGYLGFGDLKHVRPYVKVGTGAALFYIHGDAKQHAEALGLPIRDSWKFAMNVGGGAKFLAGEYTSVMVDVKDYISGIPSYGLPFSARVVEGRYEPGLARTGYLHNWQIDLGVSFRWNDWH